MYNCRMSYTDDVKFNADQSVPMGTGVGIVAAENKMAAWLIRRGFAKTPQQAQYILLGIAVGSVVIAIAAWFVLQSSGPVPYSPQQIQSMMESSSRSYAHAAARNF